jgi:hypothetical protein
MGVLLNAGDEHPPLTFGQKLKINFTGTNPYHVLLPDVPWERLQHARMVESSGMAINAQL